VCEARYQVSASSAGKSATCRKCGQRFRIPERPTDASPTDDVLTFADEHGVIPLTPAPGEEPEAPQPEIHDVNVNELATAIPIAPALTYAASDVSDVALRDPGAPSAYAGYLRALGRSLVFPGGMGDVVMFGIMWTMLVIGAFLGYAGLLGFIGGLLVACWYRAFQLNIVLAAAGGEEDLPRMSLTDGLWSDAVLPFLKMLSTHVLSDLPAAVFLLQSGNARTAWNGWANGGFAGLLAALGWSSALTVIALVLAGRLIWPMFVLIVALGAIRDLVRLDLIVRTMCRTAAYLVVALAVYASFGLTWGFETFIQSWAARTGSQTLSMQLIVLTPVCCLIELYFTIVAMHAIGYYYHYFKHRFAWSWG
jgi:hypothetical protein